MTEVINVSRLFKMLATEVVDNVDDADIVVSDEKFDLPLGENQIQIKSTDTEVLIALLNNKSSLTN